MNYSKTEIDQLIEEGRAARNTPENRRYAAYLDKSYVERIELDLKLIALMRHQIADGVFDAGVVSHEAEMEFIADRMDGSQGPDSALFYGVLRGYMEFYTSCAFRNGGIEQHDFAGEPDPSVKARLLVWLDELEERAREQLNRHTNDLARDTRCAA